VDFQVVETLDFSLLQKLTILGKKQYQ